MRVYVAGPYTKGDVTVNVRNAIDVADKLAAKGHYPLIPHLSHFWHLIHHHDWEFWCDQDNEWVKVCEALLRLPGESTGADAEVKLAKSLGIPIYTDIEEL